MKSSQIFAWQQQFYGGTLCLSHAVCRQRTLLSNRCGDAHHMLHRIWKRIRFCLCRTGMTMRKTAIRRQRKNTMVWTIMPAGERSELQGLVHHAQHPTHRHSTPTPQWREGWAITLLRNLKNRTWEGSCHESQVKPWQSCILDELISARKMHLEALKGAWTVLLIQHKWNGLLKLFCHFVFKHLFIQGCNTVPITKMPICRYDTQNVRFKQHFWSNATKKQNVSIQELEL